MAFQSKAKRTLRSVANATEEHSRGNVADANYILLCRYHSQIVATHLLTRLRASNICFKTTSSRMYVSIFVAYEDRERARRVLDTYAGEQFDIQPRRFSRDYDAVLAIGLITACAALITFLSPEFSLLESALVLFIGSRLCIFIERWHRQYRNRDGGQFTVRNISDIRAYISTKFSSWKSNFTLMRFSLSTCFLVISTVCLLSAWVAPEIRERRLHAEAVNAIALAGGKLHPSSRSRFVFSDPALTQSQLQLLFPHFKDIQVDDRQNLLRVPMLVLDFTATPKIHRQSAIAIAVRLENTIVYYTDQTGRVRWEMSRELRTKHLIEQNRLLKKRN